MNDFYWDIIKSIHTLLVSFQCFVSVIHVPISCHASNLLQNNRAVRILGSLSRRVFETRTATGSELFFLLNCFHTTTFTLASTLFPLEMISIKMLSFGCRPSLKTAHAQAPYYPRRPRVSYSAGEVKTDERMRELISLSF